MKFALFAILATIALAAPAPEADFNAHDVGVERDVAAAHGDIAARDATLIQARDDIEAAEAADAKANDDGDINKRELTKRGYWVGRYYIGYAKTGGVNCRSSATTNSAVKHYYGPGEAIAISCQKRGQVVSGLPIWDKTIRGCYVTDSLVSTGHEWIPGMPRC